MLQELSVLLLRELDALQREVERYPTDEAVWKAIPGVPNVGGTLVLHLTGNLRHFIGATLGRSGYVRDREAEFNLRDVPRRELLSQIAAARGEVAETLRNLPPAILSETYPITVNGVSLPASLFLHHLLAHLAYHLGQIDYHRRASTGDSASANALPLSALGPLKSKA